MTDEQPPKTIIELANFWRVNERTVKGWRAKAAPLHSVSEMAEWAKHQDRLPRGFVTRLRALVGDIVLADGEDETTRYQDFLARYSKEKDEDTVAHLKKLRAWQVAQIQTAQETGDQQGLADSAKMLTHLSSVIHDEELRAQRLGREIGEILPRPDVERWITAFYYHQMRSVDAYLNNVVPRLITASATGPLTRSAIVRIIEPPLLERRFVDPLKRSTVQDSGVALPKWFVECVTAAINSFVEEELKTNE